MLNALFKPWRYVIGHSDLELRSFGPDGSVTHVTFTGVSAVKLKARYSPLTLDLAVGEEAREILDFSDPAGRSKRVLPVLMTPDLRDGFVACMAFEVKERSGPSGVDANGIPLGAEDLIFRYRKDG
ncbi:hypothetical protein [Actinoplanes auranticolor]|uniref:hypothetical protein n=1 Tax=Actinoplanes auranticolor TaxID=47988 RepID=UPI001BB39CE5|nr:hypothetical protein [Actinoplanes auranticolor]